VYELVPIAGGLLLGVLLPAIRPGLRALVALAGVAVVGAGATVVSGEYRIGWELLAIDVPGTALAALAGYRWRERSSRGQPAATPYRSRRHS
jgi:hypothetical protein